jgi:hypothetical protein
MAQNNKVAAKKPRGKPFSGADDPRRNNGGRPKDGESFASIAREILSMTGPQVADTCTMFADQMKVLPENVTLRWLLTLRLVQSLINEPSPGLFEQLADRTDGPVEKKDSALAVVRIEYVNDWRDTSSDASSRPNARDEAPKAV